MKDDILKGKKDSRKIRFPVRHRPSSKGCLLVKLSLSFLCLFHGHFSGELHENSCGHCWPFPAQAEKALPSASQSPAGIHVGWAGAEVPSDRACLQLHHSLDCKESISQENLRVSDCFSTVKNKTDSCCKRFSKCCILGINPSVRGKGTPFACFSGDQEGKLLVVWIPIPDSDTFKSFLTQTVRLKCSVLKIFQICILFVLEDKWLRKPSVSSYRQCSHINLKSFWLLFYTLLSLKKKDPPTKLCIIVT